MNSSSASITATALPWFIPKSIRLLTFALVYSRVNRAIRTLPKSEFCLIPRQILIALRAQIVLSAALLTQRLPHRSAASGIMHVTCNRPAVASGFTPDGLHLFATCKPLSGWPHIRDSYRAQWAINGLLWITLIVP
jgi:hypothetical protein